MCVYAQMSSRATKTYVVTYLSHDIRHNDIQHHDSCTYTHSTCTCTTHTCRAYRFRRRLCQLSGSCMFCLGIGVTCGIQHFTRSLYMECNMYMHMSRDVSAMPVSCHVACSCTHRSTHRMLMHMSHATCRIHTSLSHLCHHGFAPRIDRFHLVCGRPLTCLIVEELTWLLGITHHDVGHAQRTHTEQQTHVHTATDTQPYTSTHINIHTIHTHRT